eukprot:1426744-Pleurochrysis_carterae.AAC.10
MARRGGRPCRSERGRCGRAAAPRTTRSRAMGTAPAGRRPSARLDAHAQAAHSHIERARGNTLSFSPPSRASPHPRWKAREEVTAPSQGSKASTNTCTNLFPFRVQVDQRCRSASESSHRPLHCTEASPCRAPSST